MAEPLISIVVCTYNRAELLREVLDGLADQTVPSGDVEVLVIDNRSTDGTAGLAGVWAGRRPNARHLIEPQQGLSHARNRGWREARGRYVGYLDDDCRVPSGWAQAAVEVARTVAPGVFGGPYTPFYHRPPPSWFRDAYEAHVLDDRARPLRADEYLDGANVFFRRDLLERLGGFAVDLGMKGGVQDYGEETLLMKRIREEAPDETIYYDPSLSVEHFVPRRKMRLGWRIRSAFRRGASHYRVFPEDPSLASGRRAVLEQAVKKGARLASEAGWRIWVRDRARYPRAAHYVCEVCLPHVHRLGMLHAAFRRHAELHRRGGAA